MAGYSARQVSDLLELPVQRLHAWVRAGFLDPERSAAGDLSFGFQDLVLLRAAQALLAQDVPAQRIKDALTRLHAELPRGRPLSAVQIRAEGRALVVRDGERQWEVETGQAVFDFDARDLAREVEPLARQACEEATARDGMSAEDWYELGLELETVTASQARDAYRRSLELDPEHVAARVHMGKLLMEDGYVNSAAGHFRLAHIVSPHDPVSAFNYGLALECLQRIQEAKVMFEESILRDAGFEDGYLALARVQERLGDHQGAVRTLGALRRIRGD
ncbi:MAG: MerR family transcriptional regulator [Myxococcota bacterium]